MRLAFILGEIGSGLRRNLSMVVSVILVTFVSLTFVGAAVLLEPGDVVGLTQALTVKRVAAGQNAGRLGQRRDPLRQFGVTR